ncbi:MAG: DoxX family protein [Ilumatobacteraceae bacterium]
MFGPRSLVRPLIAAPFLIAGVSALRKPAENARSIDDPLIEDLAAKVGLPTDPVALVKINGAVQIGGAAMLILGILPRPAAIALGASVVATTAASHRFWEIKDPATRNGQIAAFAKNAGLLGGLLMTALDTGGRPSVFWSSRKAAGKAANSISDVAQSVAGSVNHAYHSLPVVN